MRRVAKAEADVAKIHAVAQIEIDELQKRGFHRFLAEETQKQANIEDIAIMAIEDLREDAKPQDIENDWIANFFDKAKLISDKEMQSLWARVLAGQANSPGKYSKRTVNFLASIDKYDADLFTKLCSFGCHLGMMIIPLYDFDETIYKDNGITYSGLRHLEDIGLIKFDQMIMFQKMGFLNFIPLSYFDEIVCIKYLDDKKLVLNHGHVELSQLGQELATISGAQPIAGYLDYIIKKWCSMDYVLFTPLLSDAERNIFIKKLHGGGPDS